MFRINQSSVIYLVIQHYKKSLETSTTKENKNEQFHTHVRCTTYEIICRYIATETKFDCAQQ